MRTQLEVAAAAVTHQEDPQARCVYFFGLPCFFMLFLLNNKEWIFGKYFLLGKGPSYFSVPFHTFWVLFLNCTQLLCALFLK